MFPSHGISQWNPKEYRLVQTGFPTVLLFGKGFAYKLRCISFFSFSINDG